MAYLNLFAIGGAFVDILITSGGLKGAVHGNENV